MKGTWVSLDQREPFLGSLFFRTKYELLGNDIINNKKENKMNLKKIILLIVVAGFGVSFTESQPIATSKNPVAQVAEERTEVPAKRGQLRYQVIRRTGKPLNEREEYAVQEIEEISKGKKTKREVIVEVSRLKGVHASMVKGHLVKEIDPKRGHIRTFKLRQFLSYKAALEFADKQNTIRYKKMAKRDKGLQFVRINGRAALAKRTEVSETRVNDDSLVNYTIVDNKGKIKKRGSARLGDFSTEFQGVRKLIKNDGLCVIYTHPSTLNGDDKSHPNSTVTMKAQVVTPLTTDGAREAKK